MFHLKSDVFLVASDDDVPRTGRAAESPYFLFKVSCSWFGWIGFHRMLLSIHRFMRDGENDY